MGDNHRERQRENMQLQMINIGTTYYENLTPGEGGLLRFFFAFQSRWVHRFQISPHVPTIFTS